MRLDATHPGEFLSGSICKNLYLAFAQRCQSVYFKISIHDSQICRKSQAKTVFNSSSLTSCYQTPVCEQENKQTYNKFGATG